MKTFDTNTTSKYLNSENSFKNSDLNKIQKTSNYSQNRNERNNEENDYKNNSQNISKNEIEKESENDKNISMNNSKYDQIQTEQNIDISINNVENLLDTIEDACYQMFKDQELKINLLNDEVDFIIKAIEQEKEESENLKEKLILK